MKNKVFIILFLFFFAGTAHADEKLTDANAPQLPVPRFVTLGADEVNVRSGPGIRYPIKFIFKKDGMPIEIIKEFDVWRQIRSMEGDEGWANKSLLSGKRAVIIKGHIQTLLKKPNENAKPVVKVEPGVIAGLDQCNKEWCYLRIAGYKGWTKRENIWGIYPDEKLSK